MAATDSNGSCQRCGAVTIGRSPDGGGFDNGQKHAEWHARQDEMLAQFQELADAIGKSMVTYWNAVVMPYAQALGSSVMPKVDALGEALKRAQGEIGQPPQDR